MSEINLIQDSQVDENDYIHYEAKKSDWEKVGKIGLITFSCIATCAFIPALVKTKRTYTLALGSSPAPIAIAEAPPVEQPQPVPGVNETAPATTPEKQGKIRWMFNTIADGNVVTNGLRLAQMDVELDDVHPFEFLRVAPADKVRSIFQATSLLTSLKVGRLVGGVKRGMEREKAGNNLERYVDRFAVEMGKAPGPIRQYIQTNNWRGLVDYLYDLT